MSRLQFWLMVAGGGYASLLIGYYLLAPWYWRVWKADEWRNASFFLAFPRAFICCYLDDKWPSSLNSEIPSVRDFEEQRSYCLAIGFLWPVRVVLNVMTYTFIAAAAIVYGAFVCCSHMVRFPSVARLGVGRLLSTRTNARRGDSARIVRVESDNGGGSPVRTDGRTTAIADLELEESGAADEVAAAQKKLDSIRARKAEFVAQATAAHGSS